MSVIRDEVRELIRGAGEPPSVDEIFAKCKSADTKHQVAQSIYQLAHEGEIKRANEGAPARYRMAAGGGAATPTAKRPQKGRPKVQRKAAKKAAKKRAKRARQVRARVDAAAPIWSLRSDGAFQLVGREILIPRPAARALADFLRALDGGAA